jgi:hypothetical protein
MTLSSVHKFVLSVFAVGLLAGAPIAIVHHQYEISLPNNQLVTAAQLAAGISDGTFISTGACSLSGNVLVREEDVNYCIQTVANCLPNATQLPTFSQIQSCKASATPTPAPTSGPTNTPTSTPTATPAPTATPIGTTTIANVTDPWLTDSGSYWATVAGTPTFESNTTVSGSPSNTQVEYTTATIAQAINSGGTINVNTPIVASAYLEDYKTTSAQYYTNGCESLTTSSAIGTATLEILNSAGTVVASATTSSQTALTHVTVSYTVPTTGVYRVAVKTQEASTTYTPYENVPDHGENVCKVLTSTTIYGYGLATGMGVAN